MSREEPEILYRDDYYVAVNKPAGLAVHRSPLTRDQKRFLVPVVRQMVGKHVYPVHRLDRPTVGAILLAFNSEATRLMSDRFMAGEVKKTYLAIVRGYTAKEEKIDHALTKGTDEIGRNKARRPAVTDYRRLAKTELPYAIGRYATARYSLIQAQPVTGRQHQIRRHLNHIAHPIIGDRRYGDNQHNRFFSDHFECNRLLLAAIALEFTHPYTEKPIRIEAPLDSKFSTMVEKLGWSTILSSGRSHTEYDPQI